MATRRWLLSTTDWKNYGIKFFHLRTSRWKTEEGRKVINASTARGVWKASRREFYEKNASWSAAQVDQLSRAFPQTKNKKTSRTQFPTKEDLLVIAERDLPILTWKFNDESAFLVCEKSLTSPRKKWGKKQQIVYIEVCIKNPKRPKRRRKYKSDGK